VKYVRAYAAGAAFPTLVLPLIYTIILNVQALYVLVLVPFYIVPLIWGSVNVLNCHIGKDRSPFLERNTRFWVTGVGLGFLWGLLLVFGYHATESIGFSEPLLYFPLILAPLVWGAIWRYVVKPVNDKLGLKDW